MCVTMMVFSICVNNCTILVFYPLSLLELLVMSLDSSCDFQHLFLAVYQFITKVKKNYINIGWYINIKSVNEIT